jgi:hypothetical protein
MMKRMGYFFGFFAAISLLPGCLSMQSKSVVFLNPDMSGKCTYEIKMGKDLAGIMSMPKGDMFGLTGLSENVSKKRPTDPALALASKILSSPTIEAWKDVQFGLIKKDTVFFKGTAYFKDITKISLSMLDSTVKVYKDLQGNMVLEISEMKDKKDTAKSTPASDSIAKNMGKGLFKNMGMSDILHYYMASLVKGLDIKSTYQLPGKIVSCSNFVKKSDNSVEIHLTGDAVINVLDTLMESDDLTSQLYSKYYSSLGLAGSTQTGDEDMNKSYFYNKLLYGEAKPVKVVFKNETKMVFDYNKELAEAKVSYAKFRRTSGIEQYDSVQLALKKEAEEEKTREQGTLVLTANDSANRKIYFKTLAATQYYGDLSFTGTLSRGLLGGYSGQIRITKAYTDKGVNVIDSINKKNLFYTEDDNHDNYLSAYVSPSNYTVNTYTYDSIPSDKVTFNIYASFPTDTKFIDLQGNLTIDSVVVPFKVINLYLKPKDDIAGWK